MQKITQWVSKTWGGGGLGNIWKMSKRKLFFCWMASYDDDGGGDDNDDDEDDSHTYEN